MATRSRSNAAASSSGGGRLTRSAAKLNKGRLAVPLPDPEPSQKGKKRKRTITTVIVDHTETRTTALYRTKARAIRLGLVALVDHVEVQINGDDPRAGCFVVRQEEGQIFLQLLNMPGPFTQLRNLNVDRLVARIARALLDNRPFYDSTDEE